MYGGSGTSPSRSSAASTGSPENATSTNSPSVANTSAEGARSPSTRSGPRRIGLGPPPRQPHPSPAPLAQLRGARLERDGVLHVGEHTLQLDAPADRLDGATLTAAQPERHPVVWARAQLSRKQAAEAVVGSDGAVVFNGRTGAV